MIIYLSVCYVAVSEIRMVLFSNRVLVVEFFIIEVWRLKPPDEPKVYIDNHLFLVQRLE